MQEDKDLDDGVNYSDAEDNQLNSNNRAFNHQKVSKTQTSRFNKVKQKAQHSIIEEEKGRNEENKN